MATNSNELQELKSELASLKSDMADIGETLAKLARSSANEGRERVKEAASHSRDQARQTLGAFEKEVEERPMTSLAVALGMGFILGKLIDR
ncbi:DUF883 family protein [Wenzhouxiangella sp. XN24]|uniref:DUF883 family protein n=1 Tax=Wenzhouxiangella sp. XN24 TaxID=2713569 RepID=UPI0013EC6E35|nr:DUF883 family protein [Wenzhouxiangella sp. XN24]NGX15343.1 DUF883 family protein [Wenzhouxiangella sp. XN24]